MIMKCPTVTLNDIRHCLPRHDTTCSHQEQSHKTKTCGLESGTMLGVALAPQNTSGVVTFLANGARRISRLKYLMSVFKPTGTMGTTALTPPVLCLHKQTNKQTIMHKKQHNRHESSGCIERHVECNKNHIAATIRQQQ
jgi:hypothetical protein